MSSNRNACPGSRSGHSHLERKEHDSGIPRSPANVTKHLKGIRFPAKLKDLVQHAQQQKAEPEVIELLEKMPDREYEKMADVMKGTGEAEE